MEGLPDRTDNAIENCFYLTIRHCIGQQRNRSRQLQQNAAGTGNNAQVIVFSSVLTSDLVRCAPRLYLQNFMVLCAARTQLGSRVAVKTLKQGLSSGRQQSRLGCESIVVAVYELSPIERKDNM